MELFTIISLILSVVSVIAQIIAKPKKRDQDNLVQRQGLDEPLERLYGKRKMFMVITNAHATSKAINWFYELEGQDIVGISASQYRDDYKRRSSTPNADGLHNGWNEPRNTMLWVQGPICVAGRNNSPLSKDFRKIEDFAVTVDDLPYTDRELLSRSEFWEQGAGWAVYLRGGREDFIFNHIVSQGTADTDVFTSCVHGLGQAVLCLEEGKAVFGGIPEFGFTLRSHNLFDPRVDNRNDWNHSLGWNWSGRIDNPALQVLDYLLDKEFGAGLNYITEIDVDSFIHMANVADTLIGFVEERTQSYLPTAYHNYNPAFNPSTKIPVNIPDYWKDYENNPSRTRKATAKELLTSNITVDTKDTVAENLSALLAACRGARLFRNRAGKWKIAPAWLLEEDFIFDFPGDDTEGPYTVPFLPNAATGQGAEVYVDDTLVSNYTFEMGGEEGVDNAIEVPGFNKAVYNRNENKLKVYFDGSAPGVEPSATYYVSQGANRVSYQTIVFSTADASIVTQTDNDGNQYWLFEGPLVYPLNGNKTCSKESDYGLTYADGSVDIKVGLLFDSPVSAGSTIKVEYVGDYGGIKLAAHIVRDPIDLDLDYDAIEDSEGLPLIRISGKTSYNSVSTDDRYNQVTVKFPNEFNDYKPDEITWPEIHGPKHREFLSEDNGRPLQNTVDVNHLTTKSEARDLAEFILRQSRSADNLSFDVDSVGMMLEPNDIILVSDPQLKTGDPSTSADRSKYWRVVSTKINTKSTIAVTCTRYEPEDFAYLSPILEDRKYMPLTSPVPSVVFGADAISPFEDKSSGWGRLTWQLPDTLGSSFRYRVAISRKPHWRKEVSVGRDDMVWYGGRHWVALKGMNAISNQLPPPEDTVEWRAADEKEEGLAFEVVHTDTNALTCIIPNEPESRFYTYSVTVLTKLGRGVPAFQEIDVKAQLFGIQSLLLLDSDKDFVVIKKYEVAFSYVDGGSYGN